MLMRKDISRITGLSPRQITELTQQKIISEEFFVSKYDKKIVYDMRNLIEFAIIKELLEVNIKYSVCKNILMTLKIDHRYFDTKRELNDKLTAITKSDYWISAAKKMQKNVMVGDIPTLEKLKSRALQKINKVKKEIISLLNDRDFILLLSRDERGSGFLFIHREDYNPRLFYNDFLTKNYICIYINLSAIEKTLKSKL
jgi:hypothetical protein